MRNNTPIFRSVREASHPQHDSFSPIIGCSYGIVIPRSVHKNMSSVGEKKNITFFCMHIPHLRQFMGFFLYTSLKKIDFLFFFSPLPPKEI